MRPMFAVCWNGRCEFRFLSPVFFLFFDTPCTDTLKFVCKGWLAGLWSKRKRGRHIHVGRKYCGGTSISLPFAKPRYACLVGRGVVGTVGWITRIDRYCHPERSLKDKNNVQLHLTLEKMLGKSEEEQKQLKRSDDSRSKIREKAREHLDACIWCFLGSQTESGKETERNNNREETDREMVREREGWMHLPQEDRKRDRKRESGFCRAVHTCWSARIVEIYWEVRYSLRAVMKQTATGWM